MTGSLHATKARRNLVIVFHGLTWWVCFALLLSALSCSSLVAWRNSSRLPQHALPRKVAIYVVVSPHVSAADDGGNVAALVDALEARLRESGREVSVVPARADEAPPVPRIELQIQSTERGNPAMRGAGVFFAMPTGEPLEDSARVVVDVYAVPASGPPTFSGRVSGITFGPYGSNVDGAESAGASIARRLLH